MSLSRAVRRAFSTPQREPGPPVPVTIPLAEVEVLGQLKSRLWVKYRDTELELERHGIPDDAPVLRLADGRTYVSEWQPDKERLVHFPAIHHPIGSFAAGGRIARKSPGRRQRPAKRVDAVSSIPLFGPREERLPTVLVREDRDPVPLSYAAADMLGDPVIAEGAARVFDEQRHAPVVGYTPAKPPAWGAPAILARLKRISVSVELTPDRSSLVVIAPGGAADPELRSAIDIVRPLLVAHLAGVPLPCAWCTSDAVTILLGGAPACGVHALEVVA